MCHFLSIWKSILKQKVKNGPPYLSAHWQARRRLLQPTQWRTTEDAEGTGYGAAPQDRTLLQHVGT